jgi:hypothetical protein
MQNFKFFRKLLVSSSSPANRCSVCEFRSGDEICSFLVSLEFLKFVVVYSDPLSKLWVGTLILVASLITKYPTVRRYEEYRS